MSVADMISQLGNTAPAIEHLNIPAYQWWSEALHGVANSPGVSFGGKVYIVHASDEILLLSDLHCILHSC
jgi:hypothetical protein